MAKRVDLNAVPVQAPRVSISSQSDSAVLAAGRLRLEVSFRPFSFTIRRDGRSLIRAGGAWVADGEIRDQFVQFTEGVIAHEDRSPPQRARHAILVQRGERGLTLSFGLDGGRAAQVRIELVAPDRVALSVEADGQPLRLGLDWERRPEERLVGLGLRHHARFDQAGRDIQLGADRRYTGPDCPAEMLAEGGIPQGDCAPVPWMLSSRGYGVWCGTDANGTRFESAGERIAISTRAHAGPLRLDVFCSPTPVSRLRALCRATGFPAQLPEWGYGFWKSRDVHEHQDDVLDDYEGFRRHRLPLDAVVIDSPWATQCNTWKFNPHQFPDAAGTISRMRADGVRTVVWVTPWVNLDSSDGQIPPQPASERLHAQPAANYAPAAAGYFVSEPDESDTPHSRAGRGARATSEAEPFVTRWWMGTGSPVDLTNPGAQRWWRESAKRVLELGVAGIKADDGDGYYIPDRVRLADGRTGRAGSILAAVHFAELTPAEQRVLGCLIEKRWTTPDQYPLSLNALRLACNQSTNRDPVTDYDESAVRDAAQRLSRYGLARLASGAGSRATKYRHLAEEGLGLDREQLAVLCVLLLRGPQTPGELKSRSERMAHLATLDDVERVVGELSERGYAARIQRRPGQKEDRFRQLLGGGEDAEDAPRSGPIAAGGFDEPVTHAGHARVDEPATNARAGGFDEPTTPAAAGGFDEPVTSEAAGGFDEPVTSEAAGGFDEPVTPAAAGGFDEPVTPAPADAGAIEARVAALEADVAALRAQLSDLLD